ncbi:MAG TPA: hypothetical protein ENJ29_16030 [Bacteroidetes bacterium]|nr:hypothetical protein [Bacteroidota bacterium]
MIRSMKMNALFLVVAIVLVLSGCAREEKTSPVILKVGSETLTLEELRHMLPAAARDKITRDDIQDMLTRWINAHLLYEQAKAAGFGNDPEIESRVQEYRVNLIGSAYIDSVLNFDTTFPDSVYESYYEQNSDDFTLTANEYYLKQMLFKRKKEADSTYNLILRGRPFDSLAVYFATKQEPGFEWDIGFVTEDMVIEPIAKRVRRMRVGQVRRPFKTSYGYHIFKLEEVARKGTVKPLSRVRDEIHARLLHKARQERYRRHISRLKSTIPIERNYRVIDRVPLDSLFSN